MKLSEWAKTQGISYETAWRWFRDGKMPVPAYKTPSGSIIVIPEIQSNGHTVAYARVSSHDQKSDLDRQVARMAQSGYAIDEYVSEIGSALNGKRPKLRKILSNPDISTIVVEHRDRLTRFGFEYLESALAARGASIVVLDPGEVKDDLVRDMAEFLMSACARIYGKRGSENRARAALAAAGSDPT